MLENTSTADLINIMFVNEYHITIRVLQYLYCRIIIIKKLKVYQTSQMVSGWFSCERTFHFIGKTRNYLSVTSSGHRANRHARSRI